MTLSFGVSAIGGTPDVCKQCEADRARGSRTVHWHPTDWANEWADQLLDAQVTMTLRFPTAGLSVSMDPDVLRARLLQLVEQLTEQTGAVAVKSEVRILFMTEPKED